MTMYMQLWVCTQWQKGRVHPCVHADQYEYNHSIERTFRYFKVLVQLPGITDHNHNTRAGTGTSIRIHVGMESLGDNSL